MIIVLEIENEIEREKEKKRVIKNKSNNHKYF